MTRKKKLIAVLGGYGLSFLLPILIVSLAYALNGVYLNSAHSILTSDAFSQGANFLASFHDVLHGKASLLFNWHAGLGSNYLGLYSYYLGGIVTPVVGLFSKSQIPNVFYVLTLIKFGLAGLSSYVHLQRRFTFPTYQKQILAASYALMAFGIVNAGQLMWLDTLYLLPMVILGIDNLVQHRGFKVLFLAWCLMVLTNFYMAFMVGLFSVLYAAVQIVITKPKHWFRMGLKFIGVMLWATLSGGIILLPVISILTRNHTPLSSLMGLFTDRSGLWDLPIKSMVGAYDGTKFGTTPYIYVGLLALIFGCAYFFNRQFSSRAKWGYGALLLTILAGFYLQFFNLTWQGWHFPAMFLYRYSFLWSFVVVVLAAHELEHREPKLEMKVTLGIAVMMIVAMIGSFNHYAFVNAWNLLITLLFLSLYLFFIGRHHRARWFKYAFWLVFLGELLTNTGLLIHGVSEEWHYPSTSVYTQKAAAIQRQVGPTTSKNVSRLESLDPISNNDGIRFDYGSLNFFSSVVNRPFEQRMNQIGFESTGSNLNMTYGNNTLVMDSILGIQKNLAVGHVDKYGFSQISTPQATLKAYRNRNVLNTGTLVNTKQATHLKFSPSNNLGNQNQLLSLASGMKRKQKLFTNLPAMLLGTTAIFQAKQATLKFVHTSKTTQYVNLQMTVPAHRQAYLSLFKTQGNVTQISVLKNNHFVEGYNPSVVGQYVNLGYFKHHTTINVRVNLTGTGTIKLLKPTLIALNTSILQRQVDRARQHGVSLKYGQRSVSGVVHAKQKQALMLTIPYDPGWQATVNHRRVKVKSVDRAFCLIPLHMGRNQLKLSYVPSGFTVGKWLTLIGLLSFVCAVLIEKWLNRRRTRSH